jgi:hypothetical protein
MRTGMGPRKSGTVRHAALPLHTLARSRQVPRPAAVCGQCPLPRLGRIPPPDGLAGPELEGAPWVADPRLVCGLIMAPARPSPPSRPLAVPVHIIMMVAGIKPAAMCGGGCPVTRSCSDSNSCGVQSRAAPLVAKRVVQSLGGLPVGSGGGRALRLRVAFWNRTVPLCATPCSPEGSSSHPDLLFVYRNALASS